MESFRLRRLVCQFHGLLQHATALDKPKHNDDQCDNQKQVDEASSKGGDKGPQNPQEEDDKQDGF
jgi:hypothetical protein